MHEVILVLADLYLSPDAADAPARRAAEGAESSHRMPGLGAVARYGRSQPCVDWRQWVAGWLREQQHQAREGSKVPWGTQVPAAPQVPAVAQVSPAAQASMAAGVAAEDPDPNTARHEAPGYPGCPQAVWFATPVHLMAGLNSVHLDRRGLLQLQAEEVRELAADFARVFHDSPFRLRALPGAELLLYGPTLAASTREPARCTAGDVATGLPQGGDAGPLRRLGAEIEMWLHALPLNAQRVQRGELPVTALWFWGGGALAADPPLRLEPDALTLVCGSDAWLRGLLTDQARIQPLPRQLSELFGYSAVRRALLVTGVGAGLRAHASWGLMDALAQIDNDFVAPAVRSLRRGPLKLLRILANDRLLELRSGDHLKFWRRPRMAIAAFD